MFVFVSLCYNRLTQNQMDAKYKIFRTGSIVIDLASTLHREGVRCSSLSSNIIITVGICTR